MPAASPLTRPSPASAVRPGLARRSAAAAVLGAVGLVAAACGSSASSPTTTAATPTTAAAPAVVSAATVGSFGKVLVDASGRTLYHYTPDGTGTPTCNGACAGLWPPLTVPAGTTHPAAGAGLAAGALGTVARSDGTLQVTYHGEPLYRYSADTAAGQARGQGVLGLWFVVPAASGATAGVTTTTSGGYSY